MNQVDPYAICPCGSGAKIKFCCCKDIAADLARVLRTIEGDQLRSALDQCKRLLGKYPGRAALLALRCELEFELDPNGGFIEAANEFYSHQPNNLAAISWSALSGLLLPRSDSPPADGQEPDRLSDAEIDRSLRETSVRVQRALEVFAEHGPTSGGEAFSYPFLSAIEMLVQVLFRARNYLPAIAYERLLVALMNGEERAAEVLRSMLGNVELPLFVRAVPLLGGCSPEAPYVAEYNEAKSLADVGAWQAALDRFRPLAAQYPQQVELLKAVALLSSLVLDSGAIAAWRSYAALPGLAIDDAVEAEALAQYLTASESNTGSTLAMQDFPTTDANQVMERLLSDRRCSQMAGAPPAEGEVPPKGVFAVLDRPLPTEWTDLTLATAPRLLGQVTLFGRETDREARLEISSSPGGNLLERTAAALTEITGGLMGEPAPRVELPLAGPMSWALAWGVPRLYLPANTTVPNRHELRAEWFRSELMPAWLDRPEPALGGDSPRQAVNRPEKRIALLAAILNLRYGPICAESGELEKYPPEEALGLPPPAPIDPNTASLQSLPATRWARLEVEKMSDEALGGLFHMAVVLQVKSAMATMAAAIVARPSFERQGLRASACMVLAAAHPADSDAFLEGLMQARQAHIDADQSPLSTYFTEMRARLMRREVEKFQSLVEYVMKKYANNREAMEAMAQFLASLGLLRQPGQGAGIPEPEPVAAANESSGLWTPGGDAPAPAGEEPKSKLWVPGQ